MNLPTHIDPPLGAGRVFRQVAFDVETFDALQDMKRALNDYWCDYLTNAEVLRVLILSHPAVSPRLNPESS